MNNHNNQQPIRPRVKINTEGGAGCGPSVVLQEIQKKQSASSDDVKASDMIDLYTSAQEYEELGEGEVVEIANDEEE